MMARGIAVIAGVGPGNGSAIARRFSREYDIALLSRSSQSVDPIVKELRDNKVEVYLEKLFNMSNIYLPFIQQLSTFLFLLFFFMFLCFYLFSPFSGFANFYKRF